MSLCLSDLNEEYSKTLRLRVKYSREGLYLFLPGTVAHYQPRPILISWLPGVFLAHAGKKIWTVNLSDDRSWRFKFLCRIFIPLPGAAMKINKFLCDPPLPARSYFFCFLAPFHWVHRFLRILADLGEGGSPGPRVEISTFHFFMKNHPLTHKNHLHKLFSMNGVSWSYIYGRWKEYESHLSTLGGGQGEPIIYP